MDVPTLIQQAQLMLGVNEAGLARRLNKGQPTVNRWRRNEATPDYESCLMLARITSMDAAEVLKIAGHDPSLLSVITTPQPQTDDERYVAQQTRRLAEGLSAVRGLGPFAEPYLRSVIDRSVGDFEALVEMILRLASKESHTVNPSDDASVNTPDEPGNGDTLDEGGGLTGPYQGLPAPLSHSLSGRVAAL